MWNGYKPMHRLFPVSIKDDIFPEYKNTPIGLLLEYHNLGMEHEPYTHIIRAGGANLRYSEFKVSYAIAVGGVKCIALIGHNQCGMVNLMSRREAFIQGLVENAGWERELAEQHFMNFSPMFEIGNEIDFVISEAQRLRLRYPKVQVAPLLYKVEDNLLYQVKNI